MIQKLHQVKVYDYRRTLHSSPFFQSDQWTNLTKLEQDQIRDQADVWCLTCLPGVQPEVQLLVERRIYPFLLMVLVLLAILCFHLHQFRRFYQHIKNDK